MSNAKAETDESKFLMDDFCKTLKQSYGLDEHAKFVTSYDGAGGSREELTDFQPVKFASFRVFSLSKGTVLRDPILFSEQIVLTTIFLLSAAPVWWFFGHEVDKSKGPDVSVRKWLKEQEPLMRAFSGIMTTVTFFLLAFYLASVVTRWWTIRTVGIGGIKAATVELEMYISHLVTQEPKVLSAIRRYSRTSMILLFLWRRNQLESLKPRLVNTELLEEHEVDQLLKWNHNLHETIWGWQTAIVTMLYKEGKIKSDPLFKMLLDRCCEGRAAVQTVHTHLAVRIPMQYAHMLGLLVKLHNVILAVVMGMLFGAAVQNKQFIICCQTLGRTLINPFLFNAILLISAELSDPFSKSECALPGYVYEKTLDKDCQGMIAAAQNMPDWLAARSGSAPP